MHFEWKLTQTKPGGNFFADLWNFDQSRYWRSTAASWTNNKYMTMMMAVFLSLPIFTQHLGAALRDFPGHSRELGERQDANDRRGSRRLGPPHPSSRPVSPTARSPSQKRSRSSRWQGRSQPSSWSRGHQQNSPRWFRRWGGGRCGSYENIFSPLLPMSTWWEVFCSHQ